MLEVPRSPRTDLLAHLGEGLRLAIAAGDVEGARVANEAIGRLLRATACQGEAGFGVVDFVRERERRGR